jgi:uncharacterized membrane protein (UPF0127 family)
MSFRAATGARFAGLPVRELPGGLRVIEAATLRSQVRGVSGLEGLAPEEALWIPVGSIHTFTVRFALDLIWLASDERVIRVDRAVPRWRIRLCRGARSVIEVSAGHADAFLASLAADQTPPAGGGSAGAA